jgi:hypothetical protein
MAAALRRTTGLGIEGDNREISFWIHHSHYSSFSVTVSHTSIRKHKDSYAFTEQYNLSDMLDLCCLEIWLQLKAANDRTLT